MKHIELKIGQVWAFKVPSRGYQLNCEGGSIWITQEGEAGDIILESGSVVNFRKQGLAVVEALKDAVVTAISDEDLPDSLVKIA